MGVTGLTSIAFRYKLIARSEVIIFYDLRRWRLLVYEVLIMAPAALLTRGAPAFRIKPTWSGLVSGRADESVIRRGLTTARRGIKGQCLRGRRIGWWVGDEHDWWRDKIVGEVALGSITFALLEIYTGSVCAV